MGNPKARETVIRWKFCYRLRNGDLRCGGMNLSSKTDQDLWQDTTKIRYAKQLLLLNTSLGLLHHH